MSNELFVNEDDEMRSDSEEPRVKEEPQDMILQDIAEEQEEEEQQEEEQADVDDPVIDSIPLYINTMPSRFKNSLHILQYPGRSKTRSLNQGHYQAAIKPQSKYLEVKIPLDTGKFFDGGKVEDWGEEIGQQTLHGVLDSSESGYYIGKLETNGDGNRKVVFVPIDSTVQLRTSFQYIDAIDNSVHQQKKQEAAENRQTTSVQILQSAAKHTGSTQGNIDGFSHSLGDSLKHVKRFDEEPWSNLSWKNGEDDVTNGLKSELVNGADLIELTTETKFDDYIQKLINE
ncbi:DNA-directed RNA polymerase III subunit [Spathaspora sp. JA1]|nr:DNA-directed RNA polymerase III subunit [Spathaspora sp. JA1]